VQARKVRAQQRHGNAAYNTHVLPPASSRLQCGTGGYMPELPAAPLALDGLPGAGACGSRESQETAGDASARAQAEPMSELSTALLALDGMFGVILNALDEAGIREKTVLIITAKHGNSPINRSILSRKSVCVPACAPLHYQAVMKRARAPHAVCLGGTARPSTKQGLTRAVMHAPLQPCTAAAPVWLALSL